MPSLVCLAMPAGPAFLEHLRRVWDDGDAVFPLDLRLPHAARTAVLEGIAPTHIVDESGDISQTRHGQPVLDGDALVVATSGSTGTPKGVVLTRDAVISSAVATSTRLEVGDGDKWFSCLPLSHVGGLGVLLRSIVVGTPVEIVPRFDEEAYRDSAASGCTLTSLVATALHRVDPALFRTIVLGGAAPPRDVPPNVVTTYGLTETCGGLVYDGVPLDGVDIKIVEQQVHVRGPMLLRAYRDGTSPLTTDGWLPTGDLGEFVDGRLVVHGRGSDLIITGGENVWPEQVEAVLRARKDVLDVCVVGIPDAEWGHKVTAFIVPEGDMPQLSSLRDTVKAHLPAFCAPHDARQVDVIPRTALGKPQRALLARG